MVENVAWAETDKPSNSQTVKHSPPGLPLTTTTADFLATVPLFSGLERAELELRVQEARVEWLAEVRREIQGQKRG
mgnify:CR=1 FL=1